MRNHAERRRRGRAVTVWSTGLLALASQDGTGDGPGGAAADMAVPAAVAAHAIALYSQPGDTVCDPDCADGPSSSKRSWLDGTPSASPRRSAPGRPPATP